MTRMIIAAALVLLTTIAVNAEPVMKKSPHSVSETMDRLAAAVESVGATVFARIDHAKGAASIGDELRPTEVMLFGRPRIGTPVIQANQAAGLDLPLRVVAFEDAEGQVYMQWHDPVGIAEEYGIRTDHPAIKTMAGVLGKLTDMAVAN